MNRRQFLGTAATAAAGFGLAACTDNGPQSSPATTTPRKGDPTTSTTTERDTATTPVPTDRVLVVLDLQGGSDGLTTLVPLENGAYHDARPILGIAAESTIPLDAEVGLHPRLERLARRGVTTVEGVGPVDGTLSHFTMQSRWEQADATGVLPAGDGFLARLVAGIEHGPDELVGVSVGGSTPHFGGSRANTLTMTTSADLGLLSPSAGWTGPSSLPAALASFAERGDRLGTVASSYSTLLSLATRLDGLSTSARPDPPQLADGAELGQRLRAAAELISADVGVRVVYAQLPGWDTHQGHAFTHDNLLRIIDNAVDGFFDLLEASGWADRTLVATVTEFGRRVQENGSGFDHGTSSTMMLFGQGDRGRFGDRPSLVDLDDDGNPAVTVGLDRYLATLTQEWLGLDAAAVLRHDVTPLGVFT